MSKILILYDSSGNNTKKMAEQLYNTFQEEGANSELFHVNSFEVDKLPDYDGYCIGSPNYFGGMTGTLKDLFDKSIKYYKQLDGKAGAAFCSTGMIGGGGETVLMDIIRALFIHGCIVQGNPYTGHYGVVSIGEPDERVNRELTDYAKRFIHLLDRLAE
jgi:NAD(P)H dehydrogenase (quinone)